MNQSQERKRKRLSPEEEELFENQDDMFILPKFRKLEEEDEGIDIRRNSPSLHLPSLRTPIRNCIPSYFVPKKISDQRGKKKSNTEQNTNPLLHGTSNNIICDCCHNDDPGRFVRDCQKCLVCQDCGVVKVSEVAFENELQEVQKKNKQCYKRRSYLGERLRQFSDSEPRIPEPDLQTIRYAYARLREAFNQDHPLFKRSPNKREKYIDRLVRTFTDREEDLTKQHIKSLLDFIDHSMDPDIGIVKKEEKLPSFKKKYLERWAQIKKYFCGDQYYYNNLVTKPNERILDLVFKISTLVTLIYDDKEQRNYILATSRYSGVKEEEDEEFLLEIEERLKQEEADEEGTPFTSSEEELECCGFVIGGSKKKNTAPIPQRSYRFLDDPIPPKKGEKRNMPSVDLLFLMALFADGEDTLEVHGWYFVKKIMHQYTYQLPGFKEGSNVEEVLLERKKKRDAKYNSLRLDFLVLKKILTHINQDHRAALDNIAEFVGEQIETPKNIGQLIKITAKHESLYQFPT